MRTSLRRRLGPRRLEGAQLRFRLIRELKHLQLVVENLALPLDELFPPICALTYKIVTQVHNC